MRASDEPSRIDRDEGDETTALGLPPLGTGARVLLVGIGWLTIALGLVMLVLPGPGIVGLVLGAAVLSLVSERLHRLLRRLFGRWPSVLRRLERFRRQVHRRFHRHGS